MMLLSWRRGLRRVAAALAGVGAVCLLGIVVLVFVGVVMRYGFRSPILGVNEIVQLAAVALVMAALPYCTALNGHVNVDVFDNALGRWGQLLGDLLARVASGLVLAILAQRAVENMLDAIQWGDRTNMLGVPIWPFYGAIAVGAGLCVLIYAVECLVLLTRSEAE